MEKSVGDEWDDEGDMINSMIIGSPSIEGKMVIKLKIPQLPPPPAAVQGGSSPEEVIGRSVEEEKRVCLECGKEFSSKKALGGHMRVHVQSANKNPRFLKPAKGMNFNNGEKQQRKLPYYMNSVNDEGKPTCSQCGKSFPSMKSLFGHMRCHPERVWRGILPPPNTPTTTVSATVRRRTVAEDGGDQAVDLTKFLRGWSVTDRRGRKALKKPDDDDDDDDEGLLKAVAELMSLANGGGSTAESGVTPPQLKVEITEGSDYSDSVTIKDDKNECKPPPEKLEVEDEGMITDEQLSISYRCKKIKRRKKMKLMMELEHPPVTECKYKCTICNKSFTTHQALGGHRSSHNKSKVTSDDYESLLMNQSGENSVKECEFEFEFEFEGASSSNNSSVHQCKICDKSFATGQALGGHKRCHWSGPTGANAPASQITGEDGSPAESRRKVLDFDLNEVPLMMMEEDEVEHVYGYASSSYNSNMG